MRIAILTYNKQALFELGCAVELFALPRPEFSEWYETEVVTFTPGPLSATGGISISCQTIEDFAEFDIVVIPSWPTNQTVIPKPIEQALRAHIDAGKRILTFCSGAFLPAQLGFFDGRQVTTHWRYAELFKERFPQCHYADDVLYVYDGKIGCSAGSSAGIDLGIAMIRDDYGPAIANQVARRLVLGAHRSGGQSQFVETSVPSRPDQLSETLDWAVQNLSGKLDINKLAEKARMSRRTFDRKIRSSLNMSANEWLIQQRVNLAKELLETTEDSIEQVAFKAGFESAMTFRHHFRKGFNTTPSRYREQFTRGMA